MILATTRSADSPSGKLAARTVRWDGNGRSWSVTWVTMPSVPSEPMIRSITPSSAPRARLSQTVAGRDYAQTDDRVAGDPVLEGVWTTGVGSHVAADRGGRFG